MERFVTRLISLADRPEDDPATRFRKRATLLMYLIALSALLCVSSATLLLGYPEPAVRTLIGSCISIGVFAYLARTGRGVTWAIWMAVAMAQVIPGVNAWSMGGFVPSAAAPVWGLLSPLGALLFLGIRPAIFLFLAFAGMVGASIVQSLQAGVHHPSASLSWILALNVLAMSLFVCLVVMWFIRERAQMMDLLEAERGRNERLLLDVLPAEVAAALKGGNASIAHHQEVTVLFADLVGFTPLSAVTRPDDLVALLSEVFSEIDGLAEQYGLEKIKTIGDCYMVAAGVPRPREDHAEAVVGFALALRERMKIGTFGGRKLAFRIGVHSGPVIAGVIGKKRFLYDLWGDTVNIASRMEQQGTPHEVQLSDATATRVSGRFELLDRGEVEVKGKGPMRLWFARGEKGVQAPGPGASAVG